MTRIRFQALSIPAAFVCMITLAFASGTAQAAYADLKIMSFNIRTGNANDGINSWEHPNNGPDRRDYVVTTIKNYDPDILGLQEDMGYQGDYVQDETSGYAMFRRSVNNDGTGERVALLYKTDRFTRMRQGTFWLSPTPDAPASEYPDAEFPRIVNWLELSDNENGGFRFVIMNTHWEHGGDADKDTVRLNSATVMRQKMAEISPDLPIIMTGDFNDGQGSDPYRRLTGRDDFDDERFLVDTYRNRHPNLSQDAGTAHGFDGNPGNNRIDWILHDESFQTLEANIDETSFGSRYPSDHFPVNARIIIPEPAGVATAAIVLAGALLRRCRAR